MWQVPRSSGTPKTSEVRHTGFLAQFSVFYQSGLLRVIDLELPAMV
jgi:hypothetical protein